MPTLRPMSSLPTNLQCLLVRTYMLYACRRTWRSEQWCLLLGCSDLDPWPGAVTAEDCILHTEQLLLGMLGSKHTTASPGLVACCRPRMPRCSSCRSSCRLLRQQPGSLLPGPSSWRRTTPPYCACSTCPGMVPMPPCRVALPKLYTAHVGAGMCWAASWVSWHALCIVQSFCTQVYITLVHTYQHDLQELIELVCNV